MTVDPRAHDQGVIAALVTVGREVGYAEAPAGALDGLLNGSGKGYYVVYPVDGGGRDGTAAGPNDDVVRPYRIHCIDRGPDGAAWLARRADEVLPGLTVAGRHVMRVEPVTGGSVTRDDELEMFLATPLYHVHTTPA